MAFLDRVRQLPWLGLGVSTEYGAGDQPGALNLLALRRQFPQFAGFLEVGVETSKGLDTHAQGWAATGGRTTYHFLDLNLDEAEDFDEHWLGELRGILAELQPAWICGDAGLWHAGNRDRGQLLLLPPVLTDASATAFAEGIVRLRVATGLEVLPENPPGVAFVGDLSLLEFYARVCERADTGMLLDCAHLAIYQAATGRSALDGLADFPMERVVEIHVAGAVQRRQGGYSWLEDEHGINVLPETWRIAETVLQSAPNVRAAVFECERNLLPAVLPGFSRLEKLILATESVRRAATVNG